MLAVTYLGITEDKTQKIVFYFYILLGNITANNTITTTEQLHVPHYSVFAMALWIQFLVLVLTAITFTMALVKQAKKRKELHGDNLPYSR